VAPDGAVAVSTTAADAGGATSRRTGGAAAWPSSWLQGISWGGAGGAGGVGFHRPNSQASGSAVAGPVLVSATTIGVGSGCTAGGGAGSGSGAGSGAAGLTRPRVAS